MNETYITPAVSDETDELLLDELDDYPEITKSDLDRAVARIGRQVVPRKQRVTIALDTAVLEYFRAQAGERGYQTLINETLRQAIERDQLEVSLRQIIREELSSHQT